MIEEVKKQVFKLLENDNSGHGIEHIKRVLRMSLIFAETENASNLTNAKTILQQCAIEDTVSNIVLEAIKTIGYSKRLKGITPQTIEGKIVSVTR